MNDRTPDAVAAARLAGQLDAQRRAFRAQPIPDAESRRVALRALKRQLSRYQDVLADAISRDFGARAHAETRMLDILSTTLEINHAITHLSRWMRPSRRRTEWLFLTNRMRVVYQPKGVVGIIGTWNFPVYLSMGPLAAALAAGNRAMIRMPDACPATNAVMRRMLGEVFPEDQVCLVDDAPADPTVFTSLPFDHLVFTGSPAVGRAVMRQAAEHLVPVTLELGGKSPAIVLRDYSVQDAARRILHGKATNCGQICVAPDYALVPRERVPAFVEAVKDAFARMYGTAPGANPDYTAVSSDRHAARIGRLLEDACRKGARVVSCGQSTDRRRLPVQVLTGVTDDMDVMREEIFGPLLPVVPYDSVDEAVAYVADRARPLALYCFSHDARAREDVLRRTHSGGVTINDWGWHVVNHDAPFGGVGNSGMGTYHGEEGFRALSHARTVFRRHRFFPIGLFYPPYGHFVQRLSLALFIGRGDPSLE